MIGMQPKQYIYKQEKTNELEAILATTFDTDIFYPHILTDSDTIKIKELILAGADPNVRAFGIFYASCSLLEALVSHDKNFYYHYDLSLFLLENGADPNSKNSYNQSSLGHACKSSCLGAAARLIKYGADVHNKNRFRETPLFLAVERYSVHIVELLLENGTVSDIETPTDKDETPLSLMRKENFASHYKEGRDRTKALLEEYRKQKLK